MRATLAILSLCALAACADVPELDALVTEDMRNADFPTLAPVSELQAPPPDIRLTDSALNSLKARATALKARAKRLQRTIVGPATRQRMREGVRTPELPAS